MMEGEREGEGVRGGPLVHQVRMESAWLSTGWLRVGQLRGVTRGERRAGGGARRVPLTAQPMGTRGRGHARAPTPTPCPQHCRISLLSGPKPRQRRDQRGSLRKASRACGGVGG